MATHSDTGAGALGRSAGRGLSMGLNGLLAAAFVVLAVAGHSRTDMALADEPAGMASAVAVDANGVAANGYDLVAFFIGDKAVKGDADITAFHDGVTYLFANARNRDMFLTHPAAFLPRFGGYGAFAVREGRKLHPGSSMAWQVADNRLYFFRNGEAQARWNDAADTNLAIADKVWVQISELPAAMLTAEPAN